MFSSIVKAGVRQLLWSVLYAAARIQHPCDEEREDSRAFARQALEDFDETFE